MTPSELGTAIAAAGLGWDPLGSLAVKGVTFDDRCNVENCKSLTALANGAGLTADQIMPALVALAGDPTAEPPVAPDRSLIDVHIATGKAIKAALADLGIAWSTGGALMVWRTSARAVTEVAPPYDGAPVTTQNYFAKATLAGSTIEGMAEALAELVGDPTGDIVVAPDATAFDAIMGA